MLNDTRYQFCQYLNYEIQLRMLGYAVLIDYFIGRLNLN